MSFRKAETPEKVVVPQKEYLNTMISAEQNKFKLMQASMYVLEHKHLDRMTLGALLGIPKNMLLENPHE